MAEPLTTATLPSPIGPLLVGAVGKSLCLVAFAGEVRTQQHLERLQARHGATSPAGSSPVIDQTQAELAAYFAGELNEFTVEIDLDGTPFQKRVWQELQCIPAGNTTSYAALAQAINEPTAIRAVGTANGANPLSILVPCHRVIRTGGGLGGYAGGLDRKRWLLDHERRFSGAMLFD